MLYKSKCFASSFIALTLMSVSLSGVAHQKTESESNMPEVQVSSQELRPGLFMIQGMGGNIALSTGKDGAFLVDDELAPLSEKLAQEISGITDSGVKFVVNTHWHFDHTGGNESIAEKGGIIVAHDNVRTRMKAGQFVAAFQQEFPPAKKAELPVITFDQSMSFHWNNDTIRVHHAPSAHTDGDAYVHFTTSNVLHAGDVFWNGMYPLIDGDSGGSLEGMIHAVEDMLGLLNENSKIIPGHGPVADKQALESYAHMLKSSYKILSAYKAKGLSVGEVVAKKPTAEFDEQWGKGLFTADVWVQIVYSALDAPIPLQ